MANDQTMRIRSKIANQKTGKTQSKDKPIKEQTFNPIIIFLVLFLVIGTSIFQIIKMLQ